MTSSLSNIFSSRVKRSQLRIGADGCGTIRKADEKKEEGKRAERDRRHEDNSIVKFDVFERIPLLDRMIYGTSSPSSILNRVRNFDVHVKLNDSSAT